MEQAYAEEFWDEFQEACIEAGFIVAGAADSFFAQQKLAGEALLGGRETTVEIDFDRSTDLTPATT